MPGGNSMIRLPGPADEPRARGPTCLPHSRCQNGALADPAARGRHRVACFFTEAWSVTRHALRIVLLLALLRGAVGEGPRAAPSQLGPQNAVVIEAFVARAVAAACGSTPAAWPLHRAVLSGAGLHVAAAGRPACFSLIVLGSDGKPSEAQQGGRGGAAKTKWKLALEGSAEGLPGCDTTKGANRTACGSSWAASGSHSFSSASGMHVLCYRVPEQARGSASLSLFLDSVQPFGAKDRSSIMRGQATLKKFSECVANTFRGIPREVWVTRVLISDDSKPVHSSESPTSSWMPSRELLLEKMDLGAWWFPAGLGRPLDSLAGAKEWLEKVRSLEGEVGGPDKARRRKLPRGGHDAMVEESRMRLEGAYTGKSKWKGWSLKDGDEALQELTASMDTLIPSVLPLTLQEQIQLFPIKLPPLETGTADATTRTLVLAPNASLSFAPVVHLDCIGARRYERCMAMRGDCRNLFDKPIYRPTCSPDENTVAAVAAGLIERCETWCPTEGVCRTMNGPSKEATGERALLRAPVLLDDWPMVGIFQSVFVGARGQVYSDRFSLDPYLECYRHKYSAAVRVDPEWAVGHPHRRVFVADAEDTDVTSVVLGTLTKVALWLPELKEDETVMIHVRGWEGAGEEGQYPLFLQEMLGFFGLSSKRLCAHDTFAGEAVLLDSPCRTPYRARSGLYLRYLRHEIHSHLTREGAGLELTGRGRKLQLHRQDRTLDGGTTLADHRGLRVLFLQNQWHIRIANLREVMQAVAKQYPHYILDLVSDDGTYNVSQLWPRFYAAELVIAPHSDLLAHIVACQEGTPILEYGQPWRKTDPRSADPRYQVLATSLGLPYFVATGEFHDPFSEGQKGETYMLVNASTVLKHIARIVKGPGVCLQQSCRVVELDVP